ncbi:AbrB/MazE/SpoVT family DNA-binding domain-containing protein [Thermodesulfobacteriota bacterium]
MRVVTASSRGQIVIPSDIRKRLKIVPGKRLAVSTEGENILLTPMPDDPAASFCGIFKGRDSLTKALVSERRKEKKRETDNSTG